LDTPSRIFEPKNKSMPVNYTDLKFHELNIETSKA
jgi:hypothetical protein